MAVIAGAHAFASMGPQLDSCGRGPPMMDSRLYTLGFNGAAT